MGKWWIFWHFKLQLGQFHPAGCVGWGLWVFQPAPHEMPSPAAGSSCHSAVHFLSLTSLPAPVSLGLLAGKRAPLRSFLLGCGRAKHRALQRMLFIFCPFLFCLYPRTSGRYNVFGTGLQGLEHTALCSFFPCPKLLLNFVWTDPVHTFPLSFQWGMESLTSL